MYVFLSVSLLNKKLSYLAGTARRTMSVEILSTVAQLYEKQEAHLPQTDRAMRYVSKFGLFFTRYGS